MCAPTVNSYKRLVVGRALSGATWAPAYIAYGDNNRTACVRIPGGRLELRLPDSGCNPYLATAALIAAGLDGIDRKLDPGEPNNINLYELTPEELTAKRHQACCRRTCIEAIDALESDEVMRDGLGADLAARIHPLKRMEWTEYSRHVSDWETQPLPGVLSRSCACAASSACWSRIPRCAISSASSWCPCSSA